MEVPELVAELREHLAFRRIQSGLEVLEAHRLALLSLDPTSPTAGVLVGLAAQWVDAGFSGPGFVRELVSRFPIDARDSLRLADFLHIRMAEGMLAMAAEEHEQAMEHFRFVVALEGQTRDAEALAIANFWTGRCLRSLGRYDDALGYAERGRSIALEHGYGPMAAVIQLLESWLAFQKGRLQDAGRILQEAERVIAGTDDHVTMGNIQSAYGRIARRQGRYPEALDCFERAIGEYVRADPQHPHLARSLVNMGFVERLIALEEQHAIDRESARRRTEGAMSAPGLRERRAKVEEIRNAARGHLERAISIYDRRHHHRGAGSAYINLGLLNLDGGDLEGAAVHGAEAFRHGEQKHDPILMARARTLQCMVENARLEEEIGDGAKHARMALEFAREAVEYATRTQNRRLLARAFVWQGLSCSAGPLEDLDEARRCCEQARRLLKSENREREYVWEDLETLQERVMPQPGVPHLLEVWSKGLVGDKTFQQITEEFAGLLVPKIWEREGRNVSQVARKLSMSPKKVRRILRASGAGQENRAARGGSAS